LKSAGYLLQATLILLWWLGLSVNENFYKAFQFPGISSIAFNAFFAPDILLVVVLSLVMAYKSIRELEFVILGGFSFATLYCLNASIITGGGYLASTIMTLGLCFNLFLVLQNFAFRESTSDSSVINGLKTLVQIVCIWSITLVLFPWLIMRPFDNTLQFKTGFLLYSGLTLFILFSVLGLFSAFIMVTLGNGTPLPTDQTTKLVLSGPYKYVRNPMAISGVGQVMSIGIIFGSIPLLVYAILGAVVWHVVVKPIEEKDMLKRFGNEYEDYRNSVSCWVPKVINLAVK